MGWGGSQNPLNSLCKLQGSLGSILPKKKKKSLSKQEKKGKKNSQLWCFAQCSVGLLGRGFLTQGCPEFMIIILIPPFFFFFNTRKDQESITGQEGAGF